MKIFNTNNILDKLDLDINLKQDLESNLSGIIYDKDKLDFILTYCSRFDTSMRSCIFEKISEIVSIEHSKLVARYSWLCKMDLTNIQLYKNHKEIYEVFDNLNILFAENKIEHYYTSGILAFLLVGKDLERYHHDIDVFVNENDLQKLEDSAKSYGFLFYRKLGNRKDGTRRIMLKMQLRQIDLPITIFMYERENDNSITQKDYYYDNDNNLMVELMFNNEESSKLSFSEKVYYFHNIPYKAISLESLYLCKKGGRPKDEYDCAIFERYVDFEKLDKLINAIKKNKPNKNMLLKDDNKIKFLTKTKVQESIYEN